MDCEAPEDSIHKHFGSLINLGGLFNQYRIERGKNLPTCHIFIRILEYKYSYESMNYIS